MYAKFVEHCVTTAKNYKLGNPLDKGINLGPVVRIELADEIRNQVDDAIAKGAVAHISPELFPIAKKGLSIDKLIQVI